MKKFSNKLLRQARRQKGWTQRRLADEVDTKVRVACVEAINWYRKECGLVRMAVCSRSADYLGQSARVLLNTAVVVRPLTPTQIDDYLSRAGDGLAIVKVALHNDPALRELASSPLILNILAITYHGMSMEEVILGSPEQRRQMVFEKYVERVLQRRGSKQRYTSEQTKRWLAWLAQQLAQRSQTEFYIERMQPDWLSGSRERRQYRNTTVRLIYGIPVAIIAGLYAWLQGGTTGGIGAGLLGWLGSGPGNSILGWMALGLGGGIDGGEMFGLIFGILSSLITVQIAASPREVPAGIITQYMWKGVKSGLIVGIASTVIIGIVSGLLFFILSHHPCRTLNHGLSFGIVGGLFCGLLTAFVQTRCEQETAQNTPEIRCATRMVDGLVIGLCSWVGFTVVSAVVSLQRRIFYGAIVGLVIGMIYGLSWSTKLIGNLGVEMQPAEIVSWDTAHMLRDLTKNIERSLLVGFVVMAVVTIVIGAAGSLFNGPVYGWRHGLVYGSIVGLVAGVAHILTRMLNSGWASTILDAHRLVKPNEGIRRSMYNGIRAGCLFGPIGGIASGLVSGLAFGLLGGLRGWYILGIGFTIVYGFVFWLRFTTMRGLIAWAEHYILRWYLWRHGKMPLDYVRFLDYATERILLRKVGSGYVFAHRLLLDYFALLDIGS